MTHDALLAVLPRDKHDEERARALCALDFATAQPIIPRALEWVQDMNWPIARSIAQWLSSLGAPVAPALRPVLGGDDTMWTYWVIVAVITPSAALTEALLPELHLLATHPTPAQRTDEVDQVAQELLRTRRAGSC